MASPARRATAVTAGLLSIGQVLSRLQPDFPQLTSSKLRFLEVQGIVAPQRTASGYRKFSDDDLERLRFALTLQRDHYMPLNVIREHLEQLDAGEEPQTPIAPPSIHPTEVRYDRKELLAASGAAPQLLNDAISTGVIEAG
ncbi:transcriptional regulator FtsR, partial [Microbacterium sp.]